MKKNNKLIALFLNPKGGNIMKKSNKLIAALCAMAMAVSSFGAFSAAALTSGDRAADVTDEGRPILLQNMNYFANKTYSVESDTFQYLEENGRMQLATDLLDYDKGVYYMVSGVIYGTGEYVAKDKVDNVCLTMMLSPDEKGHGERVLLYNIPEGFDFATVQIGDIYIDTDETGAVLETAPGMLSTSKMELVGNGLDLFGEDFQKVIDYEYLTDQEILNKGDQAINEPLLGDVRNDGGLDFLDVIALNQYLLGSCTLDAYSREAADVDKNGTIDTTDSLMILKEVVEVTKDFVEK